MEEEARELSYRTYVTDSLNYINQRKYMTIRWIDLINPKPDITEEDAEDIIIRTLEKAKLNFGNEEENEEKT